MKACNNCKFSVNYTTKSEHPGSRLLVCKRFPPPVSTRFEHRKDWQPLVEKYDWCGEFRPVKKGGDL